MQDRILELDFVDRVRELGSRFEKRVSQVRTEEATKTALVMPFINNGLGYNVFDPSEVIPEFIADVGTKKGEKVDYAIMKDGVPIILFECKTYGADLRIEHASQLSRYFTETEARFGVLTDGITYRFYTDLERANKMDAKPFLEFNMFNFDEGLAEELKKFSKSSFELSEILATASELKYTKEIKRILAEQFSDPSEEFTKFFAAQVYSGLKSQAVMRQFTQLTKTALHQFVNDRISERLKSALAGEPAVPAPEGPLLEQVESDQVADSRKITTTEDELQGYYVTKAILREVVEAGRVTIRDQQSWCGILLDNNNRKPICRLHFNTAQKYLGLFDQDKHEERVPITTIDDIYKYADRLKATVGYCETW